MLRLGSRGSVTIVGIHVVDILLVRDKLHGGFAVVDVQCASTYNMYTYHQDVYACWLKYMGLSISKPGVPCNLICLILNILQHSTIRLAILTATT